jgi:hypothetical protein
MKNNSLPSKALWTTLLIIVFVFSLCQKKETIQTEKKDMINLNKFGASTDLDAASVACTGTGINHFITYDVAKKMIDKYQAAVKNRSIGALLTNNAGFIYSETFSGDAIKTIIEQVNCCMFRSYNGIGTDNKLHIIFVGTNTSGQDIFSAPSQLSTANTTAIEPVPPLIVETGLPCPNFCGGTYVGP